MEKETSNLALHFSTALIFTKLIREIILNKYIFLQEECIYETFLFLSLKQDLIIVKVCRMTQSLIGVLRFQKLFSLYSSGKKLQKYALKLLLRGLRR